MFDNMGLGKTPLPVCQGNKPGGKRRKIITPDIVHI